MTRVPISFEGEFSDLKQKLSEMDSHIKGWADNVSAIGKAAFAGWAAKQVFDGMVNGLQAVNSVLASSVQEATEAARAQAKLEAVIKATGGAAGFTSGEMSKYASQLMGLVDIDDDVIKGAQAILATFREVKGDNFNEATKAIIDMSAVLGGDLQSAALQVGKALNDPTEGLTALKRAGVSFTAEQKELIKSLQDSGDMIGAQKVILAELKNEFGGAGEAMANAAGHGLGRFQLMISNVKEDLGEKLLPVLDDFMDTLGTKLKPILDDVVNRFGDWTKNFGHSGVDSMAESLAHLVETLGQLGTSLLDLMPMMKSLADTVQSVVDAIPNPVGSPSKDQQKWVNNMTDKQFGAFQKMIAEGSNTWTFGGTQDAFTSKGWQGPINSDEFAQWRRAAQVRQDKTNADISQKHQFMGYSDGSGMGPLGWASLMGGGAGSMQGYKFTEGANVEDYLKKFPINPLFAMNSMGLAGTSVHSTRMDTSKMDEDFAGMQERLAGLNERLGAQRGAQARKDASFTGRIETGVDVWRRQQTAAAGVSPEYDTAKNTKGIWDEIKKLNSKMADNRKERGAVAG